MDQNVSASPGDADNLARKKPNAPLDTTAPSGGDGVAAKAKAAAQAAGRIEFMASNLSTVREASRSEDPTPVSLPRLQPLVGVNFSAVAASDLTTTSTTVAGAGDVTVKAPGSAQAGGGGEAQLSTPKIKWHDVAPPSGTETTVVLPPPNGSVLIEVAGSGISKTGADSKNLAVASAEILPAAVNVGTPPAIGVEFKVHGDPTAALPPSTSTGLASNLPGDMPGVSPGPKPPLKSPLAAVESTVGGTLTPGTVALNQPTLTALAAKPASDLLTTAVSGQPDQVPLRLNINFQPTNLSDLSSPAGRTTASGLPISTHPEIKATALNGAIALPIDKSALSPGANALALGQLFESNPAASQTGLLASTGAAIPDAVITQYHGPIVPPLLTADTSRLTGTTVNGTDIFPTRNLTIARAPGDSPPLMQTAAAASPYNISFSPLDIATRPEIRSSAALSGSDPLGQKPPLQLALANSVPLGTIDYSVATLPSFTTVSTHPLDLNASTTPVVIQTAFNTPLTDFRPSRQELSTTPIIFSASLAPPDTSSALPTEAPIVPQAASLTQIASPIGHPSTQIANVALGDFLSHDAGVVTATPISLTANLLHTAGDTTSDGHVALADNTVLATSGSALIKTVNFPLALPAVEAISQSGPTDLISLSQHQPPLQPNDIAKALYVSQPTANGEAVGLVNALSAQPRLYDQSIAPGLATSTSLSGQTDFSLTVPTARTPATDSTLLTVTANSNSLYRPPSDLVGPILVQPGSGELPMAVATSVQLGSTSSPAKVAEVNGAPYPAISPSETNLNLGPLVHPDAPVIKLVNSGLAFNPVIATNNDTIALPRPAEIPNLANISPDINLTAASYKPPTGFEPVQLTASAKPITVESPILATQTATNLGAFSYDLATNRLSANGNIAQPLPTNSFDDFRPASIIATSFTGTSIPTGSVFRINDDIIAPITPTQVNLPKAYVAQGNDPANPTAAANLLQNDAAIKALPTPPNISLGAILQTDAPTVKQSATLIASDSRIATTFDTTGQPHPAEIPNLANISPDINLTTASYKPPTGFEPVQLTASAKPITVESPILATQTATNLGAFSYDLATNRLSANGNIAQPLPTNSFDDFRPASIIATSFTGTSIPTGSVFRINDDIIAPITPTQVNLPKAYVAQGNDPANPTAAANLLQNDAAIKALPTPPNISLGAILQTDAPTVKQSATLIASDARIATTFDTTGQPHPAEIPNLANISPDINLTTASYKPPTGFEPVQLTASAKPITVESPILATQTATNLGAFSYDLATNRLSANGNIAQPLPTNSFDDFRPASIIATSFTGTSIPTGSVFRINDDIITPITPTQSNLAKVYSGQGIDSADPSIANLRQHDAVIAALPTPPNISLGTILQVDPPTLKQSAALIASGSRIATTFDTSPAAHTFDIKSPTYLPADANLTTTVVPFKGEQLQIASVNTPSIGDQSYLSTRGTQAYQSFTYSNVGTHELSTADGVLIPTQMRNPAALGAENTLVASSLSPVPSSYDAPPSQVKSTFNVASLNQTVPIDYSTNSIPVTATVNFRSGNGESLGSPITVQVADLRGTAGSVNTLATASSATETGVLASTKSGTDLSRYTVIAANSDLPPASILKPTNGSEQLGNTYTSSADPQNLVARMGQTAVRGSSSPEIVQSSGGYARLSTSALANTTVLGGTDVHALISATQASNLNGALPVVPLDGTSKIGIGSIITAVSPLNAGPMILQEAPKGITLSNNDRLIVTNLDPSLLVGGKPVADGKGVSQTLDQTLHPVAGPALIGELAIRPVASNLTLLDLNHAPLGPGGLDPSIKPAVTVVKPPETDLTGVKTVINGQILTGRLPDGTALRPDPNGIIFSVKGAGAEVDPAGNKLLTLNQRIELIGPTSTSGIVGATTGIISGSVSEIYIIGQISTRTVRIGSDALVDSTHATMTGNPAQIQVPASGKGNPLIAGGANPDPTAAAGLIATNAAGQPIPPNTAAGSPVAPLGSGNPDEDKNNNGVAAGNTGVVIGNIVVPLPNLEFFDGKINSTRIVANNHTEQAVNDTLVHGALPPLAGMDQTVSEILAARNGKQDPGIPNFDSNLTPISVFGDPKRFEPTGGILSTRFGEEIADGKETPVGHRIDLNADQWQVVDPKIHDHSTKEMDSSTTDFAIGKKETGSKSEVEEGVSPRPDASKVEDSEISDDVRNQITTLLTDQSETLTGVSDRRTIKDFIDELLHHTKRRTYRIDSGDTLEKLARRFLKDKRLAALIYLLNEELLGDQADLSSIQLRAGQVLTMPSIEDVLQYRIHILHDVMPPHIYKNIMENPDERIVGSSKLLRPTYSCRFGDRLTSIAARHSAIKNEKLWTLIAQLNGLSTLTDSAGHPKATVKRAQKLILPSRKDMEDHFRRSNHGAPAKVAAEIPLTPVTDHEVKPIEIADDIAEERATVNWGDGDDLPTPLSALAQKNGQAPALSNRDLGPDSASKAGGKDGPTSKGPKSKPRKIAPNEARIVAPEDLGEGTEEIYLRLEFEYEGKWMPVIEYTGTSQQIYLHVYTLAGRTDSIPIALPTRSIRELAECDLGANYQRYCQRFLAGDRPI